MVTDSNLQALLAMAPEERAIFLQEQWVEAQEHLLQSMLADNRHDDGFISWAKQKALEYQSFDPEAAATYNDLAKSYKGTKYTIGDIRKQRERIQWERGKLHRMQSELNTKPDES